jgi:DNA-binding transcriptional regulator YiaG
MIPHKTISVKKPQIPAQHVETDTTVIRKNPLAAQLAKEGAEMLVIDNGVSITLPLFTPKRLRNVRQHLGLTQRQFGTALGFAKGANVRISEYESGKQPIPAQVSLLAWYMEQFGLYKQQNTPNVLHGQGFEQA